jgi:hypothetical protein
MQVQTTHPRIQGRFAPLATPAQRAHLQRLIRSARVSQGHRILIRTLLKDKLARREATRRITVLERIVGA